MTLHSTPSVSDYVLVFLVLVLLVAQLLGWLQGIASDVLLHNSMPPIQGLG